MSASCKCGYVWKMRSPHTQYNLPASCPKCGGKHINNNSERSIVNYQARPSVNDRQSSSSNGIKEYYMKLGRQLDAQERYSRSLTQSMDIDLLKNELNNENETIRNTALDRLMLIGDNDTLESLRAKLENPNIIIPLKYINNLSLENSTLAFQILENALKNYHGLIRRAVIVKLETIKSKEATELLISALSDPSLTIKMRALRALDIESPLVIQHIKQALNDSNYYIISIAQRKLRAINDPDVQESNSV